MDKYKALELEKELKGKEINGFFVEHFINNGKSAAVFETKKDNRSYVSVKPLSE